MNCLPTLYTFNALPIGGRADFLWEHGAFIVASDHPGGRSAYVVRSWPSGNSKGVRLLWMPERVTS